MEFDNKCNKSKLKNTLNVKKRLAVILITFLAILTPIIIITFLFKIPVLFDKQGNPLSSLKKIDDHPLYVMHYSGDYGFDEYLQTGESISIYNQNTLEIDWACTCFVTLINESDMLFGRNFDWSHSPALILYTSPPDHYKSISTVDLGLLGFYDESQLSQNPQDLLRTPYFMLDGMNEHGLTIACMAVPNAENFIDPEKITLGSLAYMRLALDYAKNIQEAFDLWDDFNVYFPPGPDLHYLIADSKGNSAVIEWSGNEMKILRNENMWQFSTNFVIYGSTENDKQNCFRYSTCKSVLSENNGIINQTEAFNLLEIVSLQSTQWSAVYNIQEKSVNIIMGRNYDNQVHEFFL